MRSRGLDKRVRQLERAMTRLVQVGEVIDVDYPGQRVQVDIGERESPWLRFAARRAGEDRTWWPPTVGEQVMVFAPRGEVLSAVVGDSLYSQDADAPAEESAVRRTVYADGTVSEYDSEASRLRWDIGGTVIEASPEGIRLASNGAVLELNESGATLDGEKVFLG